MRNPYGPFLLALATVFTTGAACVADEVLLLGPSSPRLEYAFGGFAHAGRPAATRVFDHNDGWGGVGAGRRLDLTTLRLARLVVRVTPSKRHASPIFQLKLNDAEGLSGRWVFRVGHTTAGSPTTLVSRRTLAEPDYTYDTKAKKVVERQPDLSRIVGWGIEGKVNATGPFNLTFHRIALSTEATPPPVYPGREPDAPWRKIAAEQIELHRKADLVVRVVDANGKPIPRATVTVEQKRHAFGFGAAVQAWRLRSAAPRDKKYRETFVELYNLATLENNLKHVPWSGQWGDKFSRTGALAAIDWLRDREISVRGHTLVWPGLKFLPNSPQKQLVERGNLTPSQQERVRTWLANHVRNVGGATAGRLVSWDVVNEPRANRDVMNVLPEGDAALASWFRLAHEVDPGAKLYLNEYNILASDGATDSASQRLLASQARALLSAGAPIDGVGLQSHFRESSLTGPEQLWSIVDRYTALGLDVQATEFDFDTKDEQLQADYLRDFYTALFAHEGVSAIVTWGFWQDAHWRPDAALFRSDWTPKPAARVYRDLVRRQWWTREKAAANAQGLASVRAFHGDHQVRASYGESSVKAQVGLSDTGGEMTIQLSALPGDYNGDGRVDMADYAVFRDTLGQVVETPGSGADGDANGRITKADKEVWQANFGATMPASESDADG